MIIEIVVYNIESAINAQAGGADRIELCDNPAEGGTTPSAGVMEVVRKNLNIDVFAMIRPRGGDFVYSAAEFYAMQRDIENCKRLSMDGVVLGILKPDGAIDKERCKKLIEAARPLKVTCHRAFDVTHDALQALEDCIEVGFDRILTSGRMRTAEEGVDLIKTLVEKAGGRISIMPGSGIHEGNAKAICTKTGVSEIHFSASSFETTTHKTFNPELTFVSEISSDYLQRRTADPEKIKRTREILGSL